MFFAIERPKKLFENIYYQSFSIPSKILYCILSDASFKTKLKLYQTCKQLGFKFCFKADSFEYSRFSKNVVKIEDAIISYEKFQATWSRLKVKSVEYKYLGYDSNIPSFNIDWLSVEELKISACIISFFGNSFCAFLTPALKKIDIQQCLFGQTYSHTPNGELVEVVSPLQRILNQSTNLESITFGTLNLPRPYDKLPNVCRRKKLLEANFIVYRQIDDVEIITNFVETQMASKSTLKLLFDISEIATEFLQALNSHLQSTTKQPNFKYYSNLYSVVFERL
uniref:F-box domain-containing protein n=1 Tax=Panagrolaimus sp. PS1159 TaxID=55785 RepID=A0AC35F251_9BILA